MKIKTPAMFEGTAGNKLGRERFGSIFNFEPSAFLKLYNIAQCKLAADKWNNST